MCIRQDQSVRIAGDGCPSVRRGDGDYGAHERCGFSSTREISLEGSSLRRGQPKLALAISEVGGVYRRPDREENDRVTEH